MSRALFAMWEILPAAASTMITACYAVQHESAVNDGELADTGFRSTWVLNPGPVVMLGACLVFGCSISSYLYRRQDLDKYQKVFFLVALCVACIPGAVLGSNLNIIMLVYIPYALCIAILSSAASHWLMRRCGMKTNIEKQEPEDKEAW